MKTLPTNLIAEKNLMHSPDPWLILLEITLTDAGPTTLRFVKNTENITYGGNTYTAFPFQLSMVETNSKGEIPQVTLKVCNITRFLTPYLNSLDGGIDSTVKIIVVNNKYLAEDYSELELDFSVMGCEVDAYWVTWTLGMVNPLNRRFPLYRFLANHCRWIFKGAECGYAGSATTCNRSFDDCIARDNTEYFGGFLGMQSDGIRIA
jgi:phage-related protein